MTRLRNRSPKNVVLSRQKQELSLYSETSRQATGSTHSPISSVIITKVQSGYYHQNPDRVLSPKCSPVTITKVQSGYYHQVQSRYYHQNPVRVLSPKYRRGIITKVQSGYYHQSAVLVLSPKSIPGIITKVQYVFFPGGNEVGVWDWLFTSIWWRGYETYSSYRMWKLRRHWRFHLGQISVPIYGPCNLQGK